jgi:hypothetical protein
MRHLYITLVVKLFSLFLFPRRLKSGLSSGNASGLWMEFVIRALCLVVIGSDFRYWVQHWRPHPLTPRFRPDSDTRSPGKKRRRRRLGSAKPPTRWRCMRRTRRRAATASPSPQAPLLVTEAGTSAPPLRSVHSPPPNPYCSASCANTNQAFRYDLLRTVPQRRHLPRSSRISV